MGDNNLFLDLSTEITLNLLDVRKRIQNTCKSLNADPKKVRMIGVSKKQSAEKIRIAHSLGLFEFGESYFQELQQKAQELQDLQLHWVFIGRLQSNKIKKIVEVADEIQSVVTVKHLQAIDKAAQSLCKKRFPVWLCVNAGNEPSKEGASFLELEVLNEAAKDCKNLVLNGIMAIPPKGSNDALFNRLSIASKHIGNGLLSLGMSQDLEPALKHGSNCIRVGTGIFGKRVEAKP